MKKFDSPEIPSRAWECVRRTRQHYYKYLIRDLKERQKITDFHNKGIKNTNEQWKIITDFERGNNNGTNDVINHLINNDIGFGKSYRQDIIIVKSETKKENILCWPVVHDVVDDVMLDDFPKYPPCTFSINTTSIEINPFCWFACDIAFYPNADSVKGLIDLWFTKWFYPRRKISSPFLNVMHKIDGPFSEQEGCELYWIDFGTAPSIAFCELLKLVCREEVKRLVIK